jgi:hypothetical protein
MYYENSQEEDNCLNEIFQVIVGSLLIRETKDPVLKKAMAKKVADELKDNEFYQTEVKRVIKNN